jgi:hypothetical protein
MVRVHMRDVGVSSLPLCRRAGQLHGIGAWMHVVWIPVRVQPHCMPELHSDPDGSQLYCGAVAELQVVRVQVHLAVGDVPSVSIA